jgi:aminopeptidase-like protein
LHFLLDGFKKKVIGGYTLVNLAYKDVFHYKKSRPGNSVADQGMGHSLRFFKEPYVIQEYDVLTGTCGNEKAYNSLGIEIPLGAFRRSPFNSYAEYDTSNDNLSLIKTDKIYEALQVLWGAVQAIERARFYVHRFEGEPFLTGYGLFPKIEKESDRIAYDYLMGYTTGDLSLIEIAEKANMPVTSLDEPVRLMEEKGLIAEVRGGG